MNECWEWLGYCDQDGYGRLHAGDKVVRAHRVAWEEEYGPIPEGAGVYHSCDNPPCIRPSHLFLGTQRDNAADMIAKGRCYQQRKMHCPKGHPYDEENTYHLPRNGGRGCKICRLESTRVWRS